jgi:hypothetical protein
MFSWGGVIPSQKKFPEHVILGLLAKTGLGVYGKCRGVWPQDGTQSALALLAPGHTMGHTFIGKVTHNTPDDGAQGLSHEGFGAVDYAGFGMCSYQNCAALHPFTWIWPLNMRHCPYLEG